MIFHPYFSASKIVFREIPVDHYGMYGLNIYRNIIPRILFKFAVKPPQFKALFHSSGFANPRDKISYPEFGIRSSSRRSTGWVDSG
jgi:hypothetical protein